MMTRREWLATATKGLGIALVAPAAFGERAGAMSVDGAPLPAITVYKSPTCGCCNKWVTHLEKAGFTVIGRNVDDVAPLKAQLGVPSMLQSCHTGVVGAYVFEGHVPADLVKRVLKERPKITGLAVPGMPAGSPGMEGPPPQKYDVVAFTRGAATRIYARR